MRYLTSVGWTLLLLLLCAAAFCAVLWQRPDDLRLQYAALGLVAPASLAVVIATFLSLKARRWWQGALGVLALPLLLAGMGYVSVLGLMFTGIARLKDTSHCADVHVWAPGEPVNRYGVYRQAQEQLELSVCVEGKGELAFSLSKAGKPLFKTQPESQASTAPKTVDGIVSGVSVFKPWSLLWQGGTLWVYTAESGCFGVHADKGGAYHAVREDCKQPPFGPSPS